MTINKPRLYRSFAVILGAAVVFGLQQGLEVKWYFAIPAGLLTYVAALIGFAMLSEDETPAK